MSLRKFSTVLLCAVLQIMVQHATDLSDLFESDNEIRILAAADQDAQQEPGWSAQHVRVELERRLARLDFN